MKKTVAGESKLRIIRRSVHNASAAMEAIVQQHVVESTAMNLFFSGN
jgi:hypothetical protein